jgi:hypothetical protein
MENGTQMSNNKQQTAVDYIFSQLPAEYGTTRSAFDVYQQAKEMEKERTINFTEDWYFNGPLLGEGIDVKNTIEQHFNKTYGGGEQ